MKFTIDTRTFADALTAASSYAQRANLFNITTFVYLAVDNGKLTIRSGNSNTNFIATIPVEDSEDGSLLVAAEKIEGVVSRITAESVTLERDDAVLRVMPSAGRKTSVKLACRDIGDYSAPHVCEDDLYQAVPCAQLADAISSVICATNRDNTKPALAGVRIEQSFDDSGKPSLTVIACEGRLLGQNSFEIPAAIPNLTGVTVPTAFAIKLSGLLKGGNVKIAFKNGKIFVTNGLMRVDSDLLNAQYPNWRNVIPAEEHKKSTTKFSGTELFESLSLTTVLIDTLSKKTHISVDDGRMTVASSNSNFGEAEQDIAAETDYVGDGEPFTLDFNEQLLKPVIANLKDTDVILTVYDGCPNVTFRSVNNSSLFYCVAPMAK